MLVCVYIIWVSKFGSLAVQKEVGLAERIVAFCFWSGGKDERFLLGVAPGWD